MCGEVGDLEALRVEGWKQHLEAHQVFELEVTYCGLAFIKLLDEPLEAKADPFPSQDVVFLNEASHACRQEGLVAKSKRGSGVGGCSGGNGVENNKEWRKRRTNTGKEVRQTNSVLIIVSVIFQAQTVKTFYKVTRSSSNYIICCFSFDNNSKLNIFDFCTFCHFGH